MTGDRIVKVLNSKKELTDFQQRACFFPDEALIERIVVVHKGSEKVKNFSEEKYMDNMRLTSLILRAARSLLSLSLSLSLSL